MTSPLQSTFDFADHPASSQQRRAVFGLCVAVCAAILIAFPYAAVQLRSLPHIGGIYGASAAMILLATFWLLSSADRPTYPHRIVAAGYLYAGIMAVLHLLTYPGAFLVEEAVFGGGSTVSWLYIAWRAGFALFILWAVIVEISSTSDGPSTHKKVPPVLVVLCTAALALGVALAARGVPGFVTGPDGTQFSAPSAAGAYLAAAASVLAAGLILWSGLARRSLYLWLVLVLVSEALVVWFSTFGGGRYTVAWYGARVEGILASVVVLALLATHFRQLQRRLGASVEQLQERTEALQAEMHQRERAERMLAQSQKLEAVGQLAAGLAHDLNNFMQAINVRAELIRRRAGPLVEADVAVVQGNVRKAEQLTRQLMLVAGRRQLQPRTIWLQQTLPPLVDSFRHLLGAKHVVEASVPKEAWPVFLDPTEFEIALTNLLTNARDAQEAGGTIVLSVANMAGPDNDADCVAIEVRDQGRGISATVLERVFEPFFTTKAPGKGTGLGLAQVHAFARGSSGRVAVDSEMGKGTRVRIDLPRHRLLGAPEGPEQLMDATAQICASGTAVLIVDDNSDVLESTSLLLQQAGYAVRTADSAEAALSILADGPPPDVLLSDIVMPGALDGLALAREMRKRHSTMGIVLASGYSTATAEARSDGFFVLQKPYDSQALLLALSANAESQSRAVGGRGGAAAGVVHGQ